ncbi:MAG: hypothetical protein HY712_03505 [candidate division NC10 bacterium]|nr:hypothetical protein [candidate division NC10 bacterium]
MINRSMAVMTSIIGGLVIVFPVGCGDEHKGDVQRKAPPSLSGTWDASYDMTMDGILSKEAVLPIDLVHQAGGLNGKANEGAPANEKSSLFEGGVTEGTPESIVLRQIKGAYIATMVGKVESERKIVGTWTDNEGHSGDFEMTKR